MTTATAAHRKPRCFENPANIGKRLAELSPEAGEKFSPNLYEYLKKRGVWANYMRLWLDDKGTQWLGYFDDIGSFIGARLNQVLVNGKKAEDFCYVNDMSSLKEVEGFWDAYLADGRCAIDREHEMLFLDERWNTAADGQSRSCRWCKKVEQKLFSRLVTKTVHEWKAV